MQQSDEGERMTLEVSDGFNFTIGEWMADMTLFLISCGIALLIGGVIYGVGSLFEWLDDRGMRK